MTSRRVGLLAGIETLVLGVPFAVATGILASHVASAVRGQIQAER